MSSTNTIAVKLTAKAETIIKKGHPWIYSDSIAKCSDNAATGDTVIIFDQKQNKLLAVGLYDANSPIRIKILSIKKGIKIDKDFFVQRLQAALVCRKEGLESNITNAYRLIYGESDGLPSLIVDVYDRVAVLKLYSAIWFPFVENIRDAVVEVLKPEALVLRLARNIQNNPSYTDASLLFGTLNNPEVVFREGNVFFKAHVLKGHKTGYFLDHRANRIRVGEMAKNKSVLDVFSYAGGFAIHALKGGAKKVISIDISQQALELGQENAVLNNCSQPYSYLKGDAFKILQDLLNQKQKFDLIIIDPPSFAKQQSQITDALRQYERLAALGARLSAKGGILVLASCSSRVDMDSFKNAHQKAFARLNISPKVIEETQHDWDHPITIPESAYLKTIYYQM